MRLAGVAAALSAILLCGAAAGFDWRLPPGETPPPTPADNPMSEAKVELGRRLFYDADLSRDGTLSCAGCHEQHRGFAEGGRTHPGIGGAPGRRNVMGLANIGYLSPLTWADNSQTRLEQQASTPVFGTHPVEMGMAGQEAELVRRLASDPCYRQMFTTAFPDERGQISFATVAKAIAAFERTLLSWNAPYDRWRRGDAEALSAQARAGLTVFRDAGCATCHAGPNFTDQAFHRLQPSEPQDLGLMEKTGQQADAGAFRTPPLRNIALTGPYLHDGRAATLGEAIRAHGAPAVALSDLEMTQIEAFLAALTDQDFVTNPRFSLPREACGVPRRN